MWPEVTHQTPWDCRYSENLGAGWALGKVQCILPALQLPSLLAKVGLSIPFPQQKSSFLASPVWLSSWARLWGFSAAVCDSSPCKAHMTLQGSPQQALTASRAAFSAPAIQCPRIMDRLQRREFNSAPTPFRSEPVSAGCSYNKRLYYSLSNTWQVLNLENWFVLQRLLLRIAC